jgi:hypothetical protein
MNFSTRLLRPLGLLILGAGTLFVRSDARAEEDIWVEASSINNTQTMEVWAGEGGKNSAMLIGNLQTTWNGSQYVPINTIRGFHPGGHTFVPTDQWGTAVSTTYRPFFCNQVVAIYSCKPESCPGRDCLGWAGQTSADWACVSQTPSISYVPCTP